MQSIKRMLKELDGGVFFTSAAVVIVITILLFFYPSQSQRVVNGMMHYLTHELGFLYILCYLFVVIFLLWLAFGRYGKVVLGDAGETPEYSTFNWVAMMFCTGIASSLMIFSFLEPIYYLTDTPFGIEPMSVQAYEYAHMYGQFHWGVSAWCFYAPATIAIAYSLFVRHGDSIRLGDICRESRLGKSWVARLVDVFTVFAVLGGIGTSMGLAAPLICRIVSSVFHIPNTNTLLLMVFLVMFAMFTTSVWRGLDRGIKVLSSINIYLALFFILAVALVTGLNRVIDVELNSIGLYLQNILHMSFNTDPYGQTGFPQNWTVFYWSWWLAYIPIMGLFTARISRGRTIRQVIFGMVGFGSLGCIVCFSSLGCYALDLQWSGKVDLVTILAQQGKDDALIAILQTLPLPNIAAILFAAVCVIFLATTIDSSAFILASATTRSLRGDQQPSRWNRVTWSVIFMMFSLALTRIGGLQTVQTASVLTGLPMIFVCGLTIWVLYHMLRKDQR